MIRVSKPVIGISGSITIEQDGIFSGYKRCYVSNDYIECVVRAGGIPMVLPITSKEDILKEQLEQVHGLLLTGGHDVSPLCWGEEPLVSMGEILPERDDFDIKLAKLAYKKSMPILGICRGYHILNVAFGGTLYQDISYASYSFIKHNQDSYYDVPTHTIDIDSESILQGILGKECLVNSFHHLAIKEVSPNFKVTARAKDGVIEAIEGNTESFVMGVQWHPEMMGKKYENMQQIFNLFINECKK